VSSRVKRLELPSFSLKFRFGKGTALIEKAKKQIDQYLKVRSYSCLYSYSQDMHVCLLVCHICDVFLHLTLTH
jgi:hypothetical protein